jgi:glutamate racemase
VEEGWIEHPVTAEVVRIYASELHQLTVEADLDPDTIILGCTHYPLLRGVIERAVARLWPEHPPRVIDSADATAQEVASQLHLEFSVGSLIPPNPVAESSIRFYATDSVQKFRQLGTRFLGHPIGEVELVDLGG